MPLLLANWGDFVPACHGNTTYSHKHGIVECLEESETYCYNFSIATATDVMINSIKRPKYRTIKVHS